MSGRENTQTDVHHDRKGRPYAKRVREARESNPEGKQGCDSNPVFYGFSDRCRRFSRALTRAVLLRMMA